VAHGSETSMPRVSQPTTADQYRNSLKKLETWVDDTASLKPRQLSETVAGAITFPGRDEWEQRLYNQMQVLVGVVRSGSNAIQRMADAPTTTERASARLAVDKSLDDIRLQQSLYDQLVAEGAKRAADWEKRPQ